MGCEDCGALICNCADDIKFTTPPVVFILEEEVKKLKKEIAYFREGFKGACPTCETVAELNLKKAELVDYYIRFIIKNNLEGQFDKFVSEDLENE